ncbi:branched-chain amino acid ABC transporter permease [Ferrovibrio sp. MS7]|jgi:branched-chain amino acid transport system permease protein|uniref:branched-chain amino acid ABC transporter permease n=1 Tax=Ferrovibrio plantarum TaxID=3119164 RepID=UPI003136D5CC
MAFFIEVLIGGLMAGVMYSLVALGFVLIFKASGVFNFAQGAMVLFAGLFFVGFLQKGVPIWLSIILTLVVMAILAFVIERLVLRHLVNQEGIILFMATIGVSYFIDGFGQSIWGSSVTSFDVGIPTDPIFIMDGEILIQSFDLWAALVAGTLLAALVVFQKTRIGRALRAVADDHQAAQSVGIPLNVIWIIVWTIAGMVALVAGVMWGSKLGMQPAIVSLALKALPVLILGGFTSVPGAIIGGLIIGAGEKLAEVYIGPAFGGGIENWFAYVLALGFLLIRPQGLFGEKIIERV